MHAPQQEEDGLRKLDFLIGTWNTEGAMQGQQGDPGIEIRGTDSYEWILGGAFILHRVDVMMGDQSTKVVEMISYDAAIRSFLLRSFDHGGGFTLMQGYLIGDSVLQITGDGIRAMLTGVSPDRMMAHWERSEDGESWIPWMNISFVK